MKKISVIGLGYVGLPLALEFSKQYLCIGFDISKSRVQELNENYDCNNEYDNITLKNSKVLITNNINEINHQKQVSHKQSFSILNNFNVSYII